MPSDNQVLMFTFSGSEEKRGDNLLKSKIYYASRTQFYLLLIKKSYYQKIPKKNTQIYKKIQKRNLNWKK